MNMLLVRNPRIQQCNDKSKNPVAKVPAIGKIARPRNEGFGRFGNLRMLYLDVYPMSIFVFQKGMSI